MLKESKKLTDLGIGLHKQGQIIDQMRAEQRQIRRKLAQQSKAIDLPPQERNVRIQKLLRVTIISLKIIEEEKSRNVDLLRIYDFRQTSTSPTPPRLILN